MVLTEVIPEMPPISVLNDGKNGRPLKDRTGEEFGRLTAVQLAPREMWLYPKAGATWICQCLCGNLVLVSAHHLQGQHTTSCGECSTVGPES